jgi:cytochrome c peroxidase
MRQLAFLFVLVILASFISPPYFGDIKTSSELGKKLFFDPILSRDSTLSCASCHKPALAFADSVAISPGIGGKKGRRNAPSVMNMAARGEFFYDGRATSLRHQIHFPVEDPMEMDLPFAEAVNRIKRNPVYRDLFQKIYGKAADEEAVRDAIASFEESLETANTEFDAWMQDRPNTMSEAAVRGRSLFMSDRAKCFDCHFSPDFTGDEFRNIGLFDEKKYIDKGRFEATGKKEDIGKFKVPGLRNVAVTGPYMHDGSFKTLEEVVDYYSNPYDRVPQPVNLDTLLQSPIQFTKQEKEDLVEFLRSLTDRQFLHLLTSEKK